MENLSGGNILSTSAHDEKRLVPHEFEGGDLGCRGVERLVISTYKHCVLLHLPANEDECRCIRTSSSLPTGYHLRFPRKVALLSSVNQGTATFNALVTRYDGQPKTL